jgi:Flp pilus assembly protein TadD
LLPPVAPAAGQAARTTPTAILARADSAYTSGDRTQARLLYAEALAGDSNQSRAVFRLAQMEESDGRALALYRRYIALEPADPWGHMAEGDVLARIGRWDEGLIAYAAASALAPGERDIAIGRARLLAGAGRLHDAADELQAWTLRHPEDGEAWDLLGRSYMRSRRPRAAATAFENASRRNIAGADTRLLAARAASAVAITPGFSSTGDSDGNRATRIAGVIDFMVADGTRVGIGVRREVIGTDVEEVQDIAADARLVSTLGDGVQLTLRGGATQFAALSGSPVQPQPGPPQGGGPPTVPGGGPPLGATPGGSASWTAFELDTRLRARRPGNGPSIEVRAEQAPLVYSPQLIANRASRSEARLTMELPVAALRLRGMGRFATLNAAGEPANRRTGFEGAVLLPLGGGRIQPSVQYREAGYQRATLAGYFAPRRASSAEAALYFESGEDGRLSLAADLGAGIQRVTEHAALPGPWTRAWRAWTQVSLALGPSRAWYVEAEAYDAPFGLEGVATAGTWRYLSVSSGVRWALR